MTDHPPECPVEPDRVTMRNEWRELTFLHWAYDPGVIQTLLPAGLEVETWDDRAWVGLVPFRMSVHSKRGPYLGGFSHFPETNLRTYVRGPNGEVGVWFFSLEASRLAAVLVGRFGYGVPYHWASMHVRQSGLRTHYRSQRLVGGTSAGHNITIEHGEPVRPAEVTPFEHYLTARWSLFGLRRERLTFARASHERWSLRKATVISWSTGLFEPAGIPTPVGEPIVLSSPGVSVDIGARGFLDRRDSGHPRVLIVKRRWFRG